MPFGAKVTSRGTRYQVYLQYLLPRFIRTDATADIARVATIQLTQTNTYNHSLCQLALSIVHQVQGRTHGGGGRLARASLGT